jgi:hypothetical protein
MLYECSYYKYENFKLNFHEYIIIVNVCYHLIQRGNDTIDNITLTPYIIKHSIVKRVRIFYN